MFSFARSARTAGLALAVLALSACDPVSPAGDAGTDLVDAALFDAPIGPDAAPDAMVDPCTGSVELQDYFGCLKTTYCELIQRCLGYFIDPTECEGLPLDFYEAYGDKVDAQLVAELEAAGRVQYDPVAAGQCLGNLQGLECVDVIGTNENPLETCGVFSGTLNEGSACYHHLECDGLGAECDGLSDSTCTAACCTGSCLRAAPVGADCSVRDCEPGAHCVNAKCEAGTTGSPCGTSDYYCDTEYWCNAGTCAADYPANAACVDESQCLLPQTCVGPLGGQTTGTCMRSDRVGDSCHESCIGPLWCDQPDTTQLGTCEERPGLDEACGGTNGPCGLSLECVDSLCRPRPGVGAACTANSGGCRSGLFCSTDITGNTDGVCQAPLADGAACKYEEHCQSQYCNNNGICEPWPECIP